MAALLSTRSVRASLLRLPANLRISAYQSAITRSFSVSSARQSPLVDAAVAGPSAIVESLHALGLPWYAVMPTTAVLVRGVFVYYIHTRPARRSAQVVSNFVPLAAAHTQMASKMQTGYRDLQESMADLPPGFRRLPIAIWRWWKTSLQLGRLGRMFGAPRWHPRGLINFGMLVAFTEAIRMKCSSREGLLPTLLSPFEWVGRKISPDSFPPPPTKLSFEETVEERAKQLLEEGQLNPQNLFTSLAPEKPGAGPLFDPTLQSEGLSWCPDLTAADPTFILPGLLCLTMLVNTYFRPTAGRPSRKSTSTGQPMSPSQLPPGIHPDSPEGRTLLHPRADVKAPKLILPGATNMQRIGVVVAIAFGIAAIKMPAAVVLYLVPSFFLGGLQNRWLDLKMPVRPPIQPCSRPLRYKVRKEWSD